MVEPPSLPKPRDAYAVKVTPRPNGPGILDSSVVEVFRRTPAGLEKIAEYVRDYAMLDTFEPFRQDGHAYALISRSYTRTAVLDLATGSVIAEEPEDPQGVGFCPAGFYVPDWWDVHDGSAAPGTESWPRGDDGFVWGCYWGDDTSWKVKHLDLRRIRDGIITRSDRFGYVPLATHSWKPPWLDLEREPTTRSAPPAFIRVERYEGKSRIGFDVEVDFDLDSGTRR